MFGAAGNLGYLQGLTLHQCWNIHLAGFHPNSKLVPFVVTPTVNQSLKLVNKFDVLLLTLLNLYLNPCLLF